MARRRLPSCVSNCTRPAALAAVIATLRRRYGDHIIRTGTDLASLPSAVGVAPLSTGSLGLDLITGGLPRGHLTEYAGIDGTGKGTLALVTLAACQRADGLALLVDADGAADPDALAAAGIDLDALVLACPTTMREAWDVLLAMSRCGALDLLVLASLPGLLALPTVGWATRRPERWLPRLVTALHGRITALLMLNVPLASPSGTMRDAALPASTVARSWVTVGGQALAQAARLRVAFRPSGVRFTAYGDVAAVCVGVTVVKHYGMPCGPGLPLEITPTGPHCGAELIALARLTGCLEDTRLGLVLDGHVLGRTAARAAEALASDPALAAQVEAYVKAAWMDATALDAGKAVH